MAYKCGNCGAEFPNKIGIVNHMIDIHDSPYIQGDEGLVKLSISKIKGAGFAKKDDFMKKYADDGVEVV